MRAFSSIDLRKQTADGQRSASREGAVITSNGKPRTVMLSIEEFCRLKRIAGEPVPPALLARRAMTVRHVSDPPGYDGKDFAATAPKMAKVPLPGSTRMRSKPS